MTKPFNYEQAFSRNIGWVTPAEQQQLRGKCVAIAGGGGVGGVHLLTLARLGVGRFRIADFDTFDIANFYLSTPLDRPKYIKIKLSNIPQEFINEYNLMHHVHNNYNN